MGEKVVFLIIKTLFLERYKGRICAYNCEADDCDYNCDFLRAENLSNQLLKVSKKFHVIHCKCKIFELLTKRIEVNLY